MDHIDHVDTFTSGTVGKPGRREFFLQVRAGADRINVKCEKQQAAALAQYLRRLLNDLPPAADRPVNGAMQMTPPDDVAFVLGPIGLAYERDRDRFLVQLEEVVVRDDDDDEDADDVDATAEDDDEDDDRRRVRLFLSPSQASAFVEHTEAIVAAGRPTCMWCSGPIDPDGHPCPRMN
jgi:uncharacterized repeat protein (TIGR03847 family)